MLTPPKFPRSPPGVSLELRTPLRAERRKQAGFRMGIWREIGIVKKMSKEPI